MDIPDQSTGTKFSCEDSIGFIEESDTVGFAIVDLDGRFICVNPAYCKALNATWRQIVGTSYEQWTHPADLESDKASAKELADGLAMRYGIFKTYIQLGSTEKHRREISGFLEVSAVWREGKCHRYRVRFSPCGQTELSAITQWQALRQAGKLAATNWKIIATAMLILASIFGGSDLVTKIISAIKSVKDGVDSVSQP